MTSPHTTTLQSPVRQATVFGRYVVGSTPVQSAIDLYVTAVRKAPALTGREKKLMKFMLRHPWAIGCVDGALVFTDPHNEIRRRLYVMFAILEATPEYSGRFLPRQRGPFYLLVVGLVGVRAVIRTILGMCIVRVVR